MWTRVTGQPAFNGNLFNKCLKLDGVNDYLNLPANTFYQLGNNPFSFVIKFNHLSDYTSGSTGKGLIRTSQSTSVPRFIVTLTSDNLELLFISQTTIDNNNSVYDKITIPSSYIPLRTWNTLVILRKGTNISDSDSPNYSNSIRNPNNIEIWVNGVKITHTVVSMLNSKGLQYQLDSNDNITVGQIGNISTSFFNGYLDFFAYYNKALSEQEIIEASNGRFTDDQAKGIWNFTGNTNDDSSVGNAMTLLNSATEGYITFPKTSGVFVFKPSTANQVFSRTFPSEVVITAVYKTQSYAYQYSLDGTNWQTLTSTAGSDTAVNITIPAGSSFYIRDQSSRTYVGVVHLTF